MAQVYTSTMFVDVDAAVLSNTRLSEDYSVLALAAPEIAHVARPGQFVMLKTSRGMDPLLRRPFSIFEILRDEHGTPTGLTVFNKRIGKGTGLLYDVEAGARLQCLGPLGRPFEPVDPPGEAWMVAGGVGLAPFVTLAEALIARRTPTTLFYGARRVQDLHCVDIFERLGIRIVTATEDGSGGVRGRITVPLEDQLSRPSSRDVRIYVCGPTPMMRAVASLAAAHGRRCDVSLEQVMGCGLGGCYSCVVTARDPGGAPHHTRSCIEGPVFDASRIVWEALAH
jgi:dihydroorotate dehydrogenase electron transfer subunit